jgi:enamine deaminase RidA (YjgF/YER057c/UK114 family)
LLPPHISRAASQGGVSGQTACALKNIEAVLEAAGKTAATRCDPMITEVPCVLFWFVKWILSLQWW